MKKLLAGLLMAVGLFSLAGCNDNSGTVHTGSDMHRWKAATVEEMIVVLNESANSEWWKLFVCTLIIMLILLVINYSQFGRYMWIVGTKGQDDKVRRLGKTRHVVAAIIVGLSAGFLIFSKVYMKPFYEEFKYNGYNINAIHRDEETKAGLVEKHYIELDMAVSRRIFGGDEMRAIAYADGVVYVSTWGDEKDGEYNLMFHKKDEDWMNFDMNVTMSKNFDRCEYHVSDLGGDSWFIAPADNEEEAWAFYEADLK